MNSGVLVLVDEGEIQQKFQLPFRSTIADLRILLAPTSRYNVCFHVRDSGILLCDADVLQDFAEVASPVPGSQLCETTAHLTENLSVAELIQAFERSPRKFFPPPPQVPVYVRASEGVTIFVRSSDCVHHFVCGPKDTLGDLRDACARFFSLGPVQLLLKDTNGRQLSMLRDGDSLRDIENICVLDAEANEGSMRVFLQFSKSHTSYVDVPAAASLSDFRRAVVARVPGLESVHFQLWCRGSEVNESEKRTVGQCLLGRNPVFVKLDSELESLLLPKESNSVIQRLCNSPALDMSKALRLWFEDKAETKIPILGMFQQSKLKDLLDKVAILSGKNNIPLTLNADGKCLGRYNLYATLQELEIVSGAVIRVELPVSLIIDMGEEGSELLVSLSCRCATILELRKKIEAESGISSHYLRLTTKDVLLPDDLTISDCGFNWGDRVRCSNPLRLRCWWDSGVASLFMSPETHLSELIDFLEEKSGIPRNMLILTEGSRVIFPDKKIDTLKHAELTKNSEIVARRNEAFPLFIDSKCESDDDDDDYDDDEVGLVI